MRVRKPSCVDSTSALAISDEVVNAARAKIAGFRRAGESEPTETRYGTAAATFHVAGGRVRMDQVLLLGRDEQLEVDGSVDFARQLDLRVRVACRAIARLRAAEIDAQDADADTWAIAGRSMSRSSAANSRGGRADPAARGTPLTRIATMPGATALL